MTKTPDLYAVVRHSAYVGKGNGQFERGLETAAVTAREAQKVRTAGGFVGDYTEAEATAEEEMYPAGHVGLIPVASGTFHDKLAVRGLPVYILPTEPLKTYHLIVDQKVRYWVQLEARSPEAAAGMVASGLWDDTNNTVRSDRVRVFAEDPDGEGSHVPDHDTNPDWM